MLVISSQIMDLTALMRKYDQKIIITTSKIENPIIRKKKRTLLKNIANFLM